MPSLLIFFLLTLPFQIQASTALSSLSPVSHWTCDEVSSVRFDSNLSNTNDLTDNNTVVSSSGALNNSCFFTSANAEYLSITDADQVYLEGSYNFSFSFWIDMPTLGSGTILSKWVSGGQQYQLTVSATKIYLDWQNTSNQSNEIGATHGMSANTWYHFVVEINPTGGIGAIYKNGVALTLTDQTYNAGALRTGSEAFKIGALGSSYFDGYLDEISIFNRYLSEFEITTLYNGGTPLSYAGSSDGGSSSTTSSTNAFEGTDVVMWGSLWVGTFLLTLYLWRRFV